MFFEGKKTEKSGKKVGKQFKKKNQQNDDIFYLK